MPRYLNVQQSLFESKLPEFFLKKGKKYKKSESKVFFNKSDREEKFEKKNI
jgi:hypothetical protein